MDSFRTSLFSTSRCRNVLMMAASFSTVLLGGCAGHSPASLIGASTKVEYYPTCYEPVQHLRDTDNNMTRSVVSGAVIGAVGGALAGVLAGGENKGRGAAIGAVGGALVGGAAGYYTEKQKQFTDDKARIASYSTDISKSSGDIDRSVAYAQASQQCYQREFTSLVQQRKAKTINDTEGRKRLAEIVAGLKESNDLITTVNGKVGEDITNYTQAYEKDLQTVGVQRADVATVAQAHANPTAATKTGGKKGGKVASKAKLPTVPDEAVTTEKTLLDAKAKQASSAQVAATGTSQVNSMCKNPDLGDWAPVPCPNV